MSVKVKISSPQQPSEEGGSISGLRQRRHPQTGGVPSRASPVRGDVVDEFHQPAVTDEVVPFPVMPLPGSALDVLAAPLRRGHVDVHPSRAAPPFQVDTITVCEPGVRKLARLLPAVLASNRQLERICTKRCESVLGANRQLERICTKRCKSVLGPNLVVVDSNRQLERICTKRCESVLGSNPAVLVTN